MLPYLTRRKLGRHFTFLSSKLRGIWLVHLFSKVYASQWLPFHILEQVHQAFVYDYMHYTQYIEAD